jgi:hypothetical protein
MSDPISLVAAEIHLGSWPTGTCAGWLQSNIQIPCQSTALKIIHEING